MSDKSNSTLAVIAGVIGSLAIGAVTAIALQTQKEEETQTKQRNTRGKRRPQPFNSIQPRGLHWFEVSSDFEEANELPKVIQNNLEESHRWQALDTHLKDGDPFVLHENFVQVLVSSNLCSAVHVDQIMRDIPRTFPDEDYFKDTDVQDTMRRVLMAVCVEYPEIGYVQSMNFLAGFLFLHSKTEDACFALFRRLMSHPRLRLEELYKPRLPLLFRALDALKRLTERHAPECHKKFEEVGLEYIMFAQTWFMTIFTYSMDWAACGPVWDTFFERGWEGPLRVALFLIRENAKEIVKGDFDSISGVLREACTFAPMDVGARSLSFNFDKSDYDIVESVVKF